MRVRMGHKVFHTETERFYSTRPGWDQEIQIDVMRKDEFVKEPIQLPLLPLYRDKTPQDIAGIFLHEMVSRTNFSDHETDAFSCPKDDRTNQQLHFVKVLSYPNQRYPQGPLNYSFRIITGSHYDIATTTVLYSRSYQQLLKNEIKETIEYGPHYRPIAMFISSPHNEDFDRWDYLV